ncbi:hypothetical protein KP509_12G066200 [Ceratopteris richardii]|uniref:Uncharacterized protein n=1 Tax=Ceratopteris richardii TaxID=49495 RepID=A0A8T2TPK6_CERRI|nr:hypothetical protein KP509_12G066200 [Ceratopteris richardii]
MHLFLHYLCFEASSPLCCPHMLKFLQVVLNMLRSFSSGLMCIHVHVATRTRFMHHFMALRSGFHLVQSIESTGYTIESIRMRKSRKPSVANGSSLYMWV